MKTITIHDAKTNLSKYIAAAKNGEKIYIGGFGKAEVQLVKIEKSTQHRKFGVGKSKTRVAQDTFTSETDAKIADMMYGTSKS